MRTLLEDWHSYDRQVVPRAAASVQREECRRAFYAGAHAMFILMCTATTVDDDEDAAERRLKTLEAEVLGILKDLRI